MPEARNRRETPVDVEAIFARLRASIYHDDDSGPVTFEPTPGPGPTRVGLGTPRNRIGRGGASFPHGSTPGVGNENTPPLGTGSSSRRGRGRGSTRRSVLPSWYPRTPLRDITAVVREKGLVDIIVNASEEGKLLNSTEKLKRTPSIKKAERERRVGTLMSMR